MKHLEKISRPKQKKTTYSPRGQIGKIITLSLIGVGAYLLISRQKVFAEEIPEEFTPSDKPQDQLTKELYKQLPPSTIVERATEAANIEIQQIKEATAKTIVEIIKKADEDLEALKAKIETATELKLEDLIQEYRVRDEVIRAEADQKIELIRIEAEKKVEAARIEADQKVQAARAETEQARIQAQQAIAVEEQKRIVALEEQRKLFEAERKQRQITYCSARLISSGMFTGYRIAELAAKMWIPLESFEPYRNCMAEAGF